MRLLRYTLAGAAGGALVLGVLIVAAARAAAVERELVSYQLALGAWRMRETVRSSRYIRGELDTYEPEPIPQFRPGKRPRSPLTGRTLEV